MIDTLNGVAIAAGCLAAGACLVLLRRRWREATAATVSGFVVGLAFHSLYLHERIRRSWRLPWDHGEEEA